MRIIITILLVGIAASVAIRSASAIAAPPAVGETVFEAGFETAEAHAAWRSADFAVFEDYGWDWTYHAYREWDGWSLEHVGAPGAGRRADGQTDRLELLLGWFKKNKTP